MSLRLLVLLALALVSSPSFAKGAKKIAPLFESKDVLQVEIKSNFPELNRPSANQEIVHPGTLSYSEAGKKVTLDVGLSARGGGRSWWCNFGPMRLILPEKKQGPDGKMADPTDGTIFEHSKNKLRLVTHCSPNSFQNPELTLDNMVITEYMLYQIIEAAGFQHVKTRLAYAHYLNNEGVEFASGYFIFLENAQDMADRYGLKEAENYGGTLGIDGKAPFDISLRLIASEADHGYDVSTHNAFTIGERISKEPETFKSESMQRVPYDFVLNPGEFPFGRPYQAADVNVGWFKQYEQSNDRDLKDKIRESATLLLSNSEKIRQTMMSMPYPDANKLEERNRMKVWIEGFLQDAKNYLDAQ